ncbi:MAG: diguanylate cyclase [Halioglobus sp.]
MADEDESGDEDLQGAPPASSRSEQLERRLSERVTVNSYLSRQINQLELMLLQASDLFSLFEILLVSLPRHFDMRVSELWMFDPEHVLSDLLSGAHRYGHHLQLHDDVFAIQELYGVEPDIAFIDATDSRMFEILKTDHGADQCLLLPIMDAGRLVGSFHLGAPEWSFSVGEAEENLIAHLASIISVCLKNSIDRQQVNQLTMLDDLTHIGNPRGFEADLSRELARAKREKQPVSVLMLEIDEYGELLEHYGEVRSHFVLKKVAERVSSNMRATDTMARFSGSQMAVLISGCGEILGREVGERMRTDIENFAIDDGRGAILQVTLSLGLVTWEPAHYPAVDLPRLAIQMQSAADKGLQRARSDGGNRMSMTRLSTLMV